MHEKGLLGRGGRGTLQLSKAPDGNWAYIYLSPSIDNIYRLFFSVSESPLSRLLRRPRGLGPGEATRRLSPQPAPAITRSRARAPHRGERSPSDTRTHTHTRAPEAGDSGDTDTGGWLGVISADRAQRSKRRGRGKEESEQGDG